MSDLHRTVWKLRCPVLLAFTAACLLAATARSAETNTNSAASAQPSVRAAAASLSSFRLKPGLRLEIVATEPAIAAPVAMAFDENGRLFVLERPDSPRASGANANVGRVRRLEDTEGEGQYNSSTLYATNLPWASAIACYGGGVFVVSGHELVYLKDTNGTGVASVRNAIFNGFAITNRSGAPALANNFNWGLDNRIHAASAGGTGLAPGSAAPDAALVSLTSADFSFDPRELTMQAETGPGLSGLTFDNWGRKFICDPMRPLRTPAYELRYFARNPFFPAPDPLLDAASPATYLFTFAHPPTNHLPRVASPPGNAPSGTWLTNACGCVVYRGTALPSIYLGNAFVADPAAHIVHRFVLAESAHDVKAVRPTDEAVSEFLASSDPAFRPLQLANGPDGALYILDRRDADDGGRIYRVVPSAFKRPRLPQLARATTYESVAMLSHPNGWHRDTAARLLYERRDAGAVRLLASVLATSRLPLARLHALHALDGLNALTPANLQIALRDTEPRIRQHAVQLCEKLAQRGSFPAALWSQLQGLGADPSPYVRYQLAFTTGELRQPNSAVLLANLLARDRTNTWMQAAVFSSVADGAGDLFLALTRDASVRRDPVGQEWLMQLAKMIGLKGAAPEVDQVLGLIELLPNEPLPAFALLYALGDGLHWTRSALALADATGRMQPFYAQAMNALLAGNLAVPLRMRAIQVLSVGPYAYANAGDLLLLQLGSGQPEVIQSAALATLGRYADPRIVPAVVQRLRLLTPALRTEAVGALLARDERVAQVMTAIENGNVDRADLSSAQVSFLRTARDAAVRQQAQRLFGPVTGERPELVQRFRGALALKGSPNRGRELFSARCAVCHQAAGAAPQLGPSLAPVRIHGREYVLRKILEPNAAVRPDYPTYLAETSEGENLVGLLREENAATLTLQPLKGPPIVLPRDNLLFLQRQPWSLMPERLEAGLTAQNLADLVEYVITAAP